MAAKRVELCEAIVTRIKSRTYDIAIEVERRLTPFKSIEELATTKVWVFDGVRSTARVSRGAYLTTYKPVVAVLRKLANDKDAEREEADSHLKLAEDIEDQLRDVNLASLGFESFDEELETDPYNLEAAKVLGSFVKEIVLEYAG